MGIFSEEPFLAAVTPPERDLLRRTGVAQVYQPDEVIVRQGDHGDLVVVIESGWAAVSATTDGGRRVIFGLCGPMDPESPCSIAGH
jgi:CRP-like cAMP-binding protein